jgi:hypothetical protein
MNAYVIQFTMLISSTSGLKQSILRYRMYGAMRNGQNLFNLDIVTSRQVNLLIHGHLLPSKG